MTEITEYMSRKQVCEYLRLCNDTVKKYGEQGLLEVNYDEQRPRYTRESVEKFIETRQEYKLKTL